MLGKYGRFKEPIIRGYAREILQGLQYLHMNKILHRDVKGSNILVDHDGGCKLSDFGYALPSFSFCCACTLDL
eukprot:2820621-Rhodomonas_salina.1